MGLNPAPQKVGEPDIELLARIIRDVLIRYHQACRIPAFDSSRPATTESGIVEDLFTVGEAAVRLNLSDRQVRYAVDHGHLKAVRLKGKRRGPIRVPAGAIQDYLADCLVRPSRPTSTPPSPPKGRPFKHLKGPSRKVGGTSLGS